MILKTLFTYPIRALFLCSILLILIVVQPGLGQEAPEQRSMPSLIVGDPCAPPCWFGLEAGKSDLGSLLFMLEDYPQFKNKRLSVGLIDGHIMVEFHILDLDLLLKEFIANKRIVLEQTQYADNDDAPEDFYIINELAAIYFNPDFVPETIEIPPYLFPDYFTDNSLEWPIAAISAGVLQYIPLDEVFEKLGPPDIIRGGAFFYKEYLLLYYEQIPLVVQVENIDGKPCNIRDVLTAFHAVRVYYLTPGAYENDMIGLAEAEISDTFEISEDVWRSWVNGEVDETCRLAILLPD